MNAGTVGSRPLGWVAGSIRLSWEAVVTCLVTIGAAVALILIPFGIGATWFPVQTRRLLLRVDRLSELHRQYTGVSIRTPQLCDDRNDEPSARWGHLLEVLRDPELWRLLRWSILGPTAGGLLAFAPIGLLGWGLEGIVIRPVLTLAFDVAPTGWQGFIPVPETANLVVGAVIGVGLLLVGALPARWWLRASGRVSVAALGSRSPTSPEGRNPTTAVPG